jgi:hypothetical protein
VPRNRGSVFSGWGDAQSDNERRHTVPGTYGERESSRGPSSHGPCGLVHSDGIRPPERDGDIPSAGHGDPSSSAGGEHSPWSEYRVVYCREPRTGKIVARRIEPTIQPLAHGVPGRVGLLRGAGNAIVSQVAAEFVMAYMEAV